MNRHRLIDLPRVATPELLPIVQWSIERILRDGGRVLEFGSGHSTIWFAELGAEVSSVEHDPIWYEAVKGWLIERGLGASLFCCRRELAALAANKYEDGWFDLALVDSYQHFRHACVMAVRAKIRPGGWLVLDDAQWPGFADVPTLMKPWKRYSIIGKHLRKTGITAPVQTDFYQRPGGDACSS